MIPKKGDIVWIEEVWSGLIGEVVEHDLNARNLVLSFPKHLNWRYLHGGLRNSRAFHPIDINDIKVLSPKEVFEKMLELFQCQLGKLEKEVSGRIKNVMF